MKKLIISIIALLGVMVPSITMAQGTGPEPYAVLSESNTKLTFYYNDNKPSDGMSVGPFSSDDERGWKDYTTDITSVEFDDSFASCTSLASTAYWFYGFYNLTSITGLEYLNTDNVTNMNSMFYRCAVLTTLDVSHFNTDNVTNMRQMFYGCSSVTALDVSGFNTGNVTNMYYMFYNCSSLMSLDVSNFNTEKVTDMRRMFYYCPNLTSLNLSSFNTNNVTDMSYMFYQCSGLTNLDISNFNTVNVTDMGYMFWRCSGLKSLDLSSFNTANVTSTQGMFNGCSDLTTIFVDEGWNINAVMSSTNMFSGCPHLIGGKGTSYNADETDKNYAHIDGGTNNPGYLTDIREPYALLSEGNSVLTFYYDKQKETRGGMDLTYTPWRADETKETITKVVFDASFADCTSLTTTDSWFNECTNLATIENMGNLNTEHVTNMSAMFRMCTSLTSIDFENFNTSNATTLDNMFFGCTGLTNLDLSHFNTANVEDMHSMFAGCTKLTTLDLSHFETSSLTNIQGMFSGCELLETVDLSSWNTASVTDVRFLFNYCTSLTTVYVGSTWDLSSVTTEMGSYVFNNCNNIEGGQGTKYRSQYNDYTYAHIDRGTSYPGYFRGHSEPYVEYDNTVLTFYYDDQKDYRDGISIVPFGNNPPSWSEYCYNGIKTVVFDESFANCTTLTSTSNWFYNCNKLTTINNIQNLKTDNVEDMQMMFWRCSSLTNIDLSNFNTENVTNMRSMFEGCSMLESIDVSGFNTGKVTDMHAMFYQCYSLKYIFASSFNTENVTNMQSMFGECTNMVVLDLSSFKTDKVTNMIGMFYESPDLTTIYVGSGWSTAGITDEYYSQNMFLNCKGLEGGKGTHYKEDHIDATYARIDEGENSDSPGYLTDTNSRVPYAVLSDDKTMLIFYYDHKKESRGGMDVGPFNWYDKREWNDYSSKITSVVFNKSFANCTSLTSTSYWFEGCDKLTTITGIENLKTDNVKSMISMFYDCSSLNSLDVRNFKTDNVTNMNQMFRGCSSLTNLDVSRFNTANVVDMSFMFGTCSKLTSLDVTNFKTDNVTDMHGMFCLCSGLTSLDVTKFKTDNVTDMGGMFDSCSSLTSLDLSSFNTSKVEYDADNYIWGIEGMFDGCSSLTTIFVGDGWNVENLTESTRVFKDCDVLVGGKGTTYDANHTDYTYAHIDGGPNSDTPGYFTRSGDEPYKFPEPYAVLTDNDDDVTTDEGTVKGKTLTFYYDSKKVAHGGMSVGPFDINSGASWKSERDKITSVVFDDTFADFTSLTSTAQWFFLCSKLKTITGVANLKTDNVTIMYEMFEGCHSLTSLDVSGFNTKNVTSMTGMFKDCSSLTSLDVSGFNTKNVTSMHSMFYGCSSLTSLDVSGFNTENVTGMDYMFDGCSRLTNLDVTRFKTDKVTSMYLMFAECSNLTSLDVSRFKTDMVTIMNGMFSGCSSLTSLDVSGFNTENVKNMAGLFSGCSSLTNLNVSGFNTENVTNMGGMFYGCSSLTSLDVSGFNTENVASMVGMFEECSSLTSLDVSGFKTDKVTSMKWMFYGCSSLTSLDVSGFNTENVTEMDYMFRGCSRLTSLDLSGFNTDNVTNMRDMFSGCSSLTSLDVSGFKTDEVTSMKWMFYGCSSLTSLDVSGFNTENVASMVGMFEGCSCLTSLDVSGFNTENVTGMGYMFDGCSSLTSLDLSSFNISKVEYDADNDCYGIGYMFSGCSALTTIYVGEGWNIENLTESTDVFKDCTALVGGAGTPYDQNHTDIEYARIDEPDNSKPGYFTKAGKLGDVNGDGFVNIADAQAMVSYILGTYEGTFNVSLADMNNDGVIDIFDVTLVVNITLEDDTNNPSGSRAFTRGDNSQAEMIRLKAEANNIYLSIDEAERFTAFQFDITLPEGVELTGVELAAGTTDHMLKFVKHRGNRYRVVGLSFTNELLATSDGKLIELQVSNAVSENDVSINNVLFVTPSNKVATHIGGIEYNQLAEDDTIYNLSGQKLNVNRQQLSKGVYIINHKKVIIK